MLLIAFALGYFLTNWLLSSRQAPAEQEAAPATQQTQNQSQQPTAKKEPTPEEVKVYITTQLLPELQKTYPQCQDTLSWSSLTDCIALKAVDLKNPSAQIEQLVDPAYKPYVMPDFWAKVYTYNGILLGVPAKDEYALEGKRRAVRALVQSQIIT